MGKAKAASYKWLADRIEAETGIKAKPVFEDHRKTVRIKFSDTLGFRPEWESYNADGSVAVHFSLNALPASAKEHHVQCVIARLKSGT